MKKKDVLALKEIENQREVLMKEMEEELRVLDLKYDKLLSNLCDKRSTQITNKDVLSEYWLRVLTNHKILKDFISEEDKNILRKLKNIRSEKLDDAASFILFFEFEPNEYFTNKEIVKTYRIGTDYLLESIESTPIEWKEGKNICVKKVQKTLKNKKTGEKKTVEQDEHQLTFFNFFTNLRVPTAEEIKSVDFETEKKI